MKKGFRRSGFLVALLVFVFALTGCGNKTGETSYKVTLTEDQTRLDVELKADTSKGFEWKYYTDNNVLTEITQTPENDIFSNTYILKYRFNAQVSESDTIYFVLSKNGDVETAKSYSYSVDVSNDGIITLGDVKEDAVKDLPKLMEKMNK